MTLFDFRGSSALDLDTTAHAPASDPLQIDDLLSRGSEELGLAVDGEGFLILSEGVDVG